MREGKRQERANVFWLHCRHHFGIPQENPYFPVERNQDWDNEWQNAWWSETLCVHYFISLINVAVIFFPHSFTCFCVCLCVPACIRVCVCLCVYMHTFLVLTFGFTPYTIICFYLLACLQVCFCCCCWQLTLFPWMLCSHGHHPICENRWYDHC